MADLGTVLDEARIVIEPGLQEAGISLIWEVAAACRWCRPTITACCRSSSTSRATACRRWKAARCAKCASPVAVESDLVAVHFRDSGPGVAQPDELFRPFQAGAHSFGLGLYISRAILRAHGGGLQYVPETTGSCFTVELWPVENQVEG